MDKSGTLTKGEPDVTDVAVDGIPVYRLFALVAAPHDLGVEVIMLRGDNQATAERIAAPLGIDTVIAEVLRDEKAAKIADPATAGQEGRDDR